jgi:hypothetical protein
MSIGPNLLKRRKCFSWRNKKERQRHMKNGLKNRRKLNKNKRKSK